MEKLAPPQMRCGVQRPSPLMNGHWGYDDRAGPSPPIRSPGIQRVRVLVMVVVEAGGEGVSWSWGGVLWGKKGRVVDNGETTTTWPATCFGGMCGCKKQTKKRAWLHEAALQFKGSNILNYVSCHQFVLLGVGLDIKVSRYENTSVTRPRCDVYCDYFLLKRTKTLLLLHND